jgi:hypothetical protein
MVALLCLAWLPAAAQSLALPDTDRSAIRSVIQSQMSAFQRDDGDGAFSLASPFIQGLFQNPEHFMSMVRRGYQPVYRPKDVRFRDIVEFQGQPTQRVMVIGPDGKPIMALYMMQKQPDGSWRINGCVLMEPDEQIV